MRFDLLAEHHRLAQRAQASGRGVPLPSPLASAINSHVHGRCPPYGWIAAARLAINPKSIRP